MELSEEQWELIKDIVPGKEGDPGRHGQDNRLFVNAILYVIKTGIGWRKLPEKYGKWSSVWKRFDRWCKRGTWSLIFDQIKPEVQDTVSVDSTTVRVHQEGTRYIKKLQRFGIDR